MRLSVLILDRIRHSDVSGGVGLALLILMACVSAPVARAEYAIETIAVGGYNSRAVSALISERLTSGGAPFDYAFVMVGTNDSLNEGAFVPLDEFQINLRNMLQRLVNFGVAPIVAEIPPPIDSLVIPRHPGLGDLPSVLVSRYNVAVYAAAAATSPTTPVVPIHVLFAPHVDLTAASWIRNPLNSGIADGVHPTAEGYRRIAIQYSQMVPIPQYDSKRIVLFGDSITASIPYLEPNRIQDVMLKLVNVTAAPVWRAYR